MAFYCSTPLASVYCKTDDLPNPTDRRDQRSSAWRRSDQPTHQSLSVVRAVDSGRELVLLMRRLDRLDLLANGNVRPSQDELLSLPPPPCSVSLQGLVQTRPCGPLVELGRRRSPRRLLRHQPFKGKPKASSPTDSRPKAKLGPRRHRARRAWSRAFRKTANDGNDLHLAVDRAGAQVNRSGFGLALDDLPDRGRVGDSS